MEKKINSAKSTLPAAARGAGTWFEVKDWSDTHVHTHVHTHTRTHTHTHTHTYFSNNVEALALDQNYQRLKSWKG
jgi:hypothetical protein